MKHSYQDLVVGDRLLSLPDSCLIMRGLFLPAWRGSGLRLELLQKFPAAAAHGRAAGGCQEFQDRQYSGTQSRLQQCEVSQALHGKGPDDAAGVFKIVEEDRNRPLAFLI